MNSQIRNIIIYNTKGNIERMYLKKSDINLSGLMPGLYILITEYEDQHTKRNLIYIK